MVYRPGDDDMKFISLSGISEKKVVTDKQKDNEVILKGYLPYLDLNYDTL